MKISDIVQEFRVMDRFAPEDYGHHMEYCITKLKDDRAYCQSDRAVSAWILLKDLQLKPEPNNQYLYVIQRNVLRQLKEKELEK